MRTLILIFLFLSPLIISGCSKGEYDTFATCLTEKEVIMYGTDWCSHCQNQKRMFGKSFQFVQYINCDRNKVACDGADVRGYPTWNINGTNYPGEQSLDRLAYLTGCEL
jgi:glutaredoxin